MKLIIYKKNNKIANLFSLLIMLRKLENDCMHRLTIEAMKEPDVMICEYDPELKAVIVEMTDFMNCEKEFESKKEMITNG